MSARVVVLREDESRMQSLGASFWIAAKNATLLNNHLQELINDTSFDVKVWQGNQAYLKVDKVDASEDVDKVVVLREVDSRM